MSTSPCPICDKPVSEPAYRPFCSKRCADVDLQRWFAGRYAIPTVEAEEGPDQGDESDA
ncbi:MAG: DNA gyrase inhibitor YacG [Proteobacteria bacterium]|nr:DNA gyrase inhibitor YacG [Pseudomonadota bacterium]